MAKKPKLFALHIDSNGSCDWVGEVLAETETTIRMELCDALLLCCGLWNLSGELRDLPKQECRLFNDRDACAIAAERMNT